MYGIPPGSQATTANAMELKGEITPGGVSCVPRVQFDFKRTKEVVYFQKRVGDATWGVDSGSIPAGTDDDIKGNDADEDLHDMNDAIWVIDAPVTFILGATTIDFYQAEHDFREWVELILNKSSNVATPMSGEKCSSVFSWHSIHSIKKDTTTGTWSRNDDRPNQIRPEPLTIGFQPKE